MIKISSYKIWKHGTDNTHFISELALIFSENGPEELNRVVQRQIR